MMNWFPKHPLPMRTLFRHCFLVNFAVEPAVMKRLLPSPLEPDLHHGMAYLSVVIADMEKMRPAFLPRCLGTSYTQVVYRVVVKCGAERGVHFLRSDADDSLMCRFGNLFTFFHFTYSAIQWQEEPGYLHFDLQAPAGDHADIQATFAVGQPLEAMPSNSRFCSLAQAQAFLVELYAAYAPAAPHVDCVRIHRGEWHIQIVADERGRYDFLSGSAVFPAGAAMLDSVFYVRDLPYYWFTLEKLCPERSSA